MFYTDSQLPHLHEDNPAYVGCDSHSVCTETTVRLDYFSWPILLQNTVCLLNVIVQFAAVNFVYTSKKLKQGAFQVLLTVLSCSVVFRTLFSVACVLYSSFLDMKGSVYAMCIHSSLLVDYSSNFFSVLLVFLMSLNRCLLFVSRHWNHRLFYKYRVILPISISGLLSVTATLTMVHSSEIERSYFLSLGFVDVGNRKGLRNIINRFFYLFPIGSIVCYLILFHHLRQKTLGLAVSSQQNRGERKVFVQILITAVFYGIMSLIIELMAFVDWSRDPKLQLSLISVLNVINYLPETAIPLLLMCSSSQLRTRISKWIAPTLSSTMAATQNNSTSMR